MAYLYGVSICFIVFAVAALYRVVIFKRLRQELASQTATSTGRQSDTNPNLINVLKEHKSRFPVSRTRTLSNVFIGVQMLAAAVGAALGIAAQSQTHSLYHLITAAR